MSKKHDIENSNKHYSLIEHHFRMMDDIALRSYNAVQKRKSILQYPLLEHIRQLKKIGTSPFCEILLHEYRDTDSFRYRWVIDVHVKPKRIKGHNAKAQYAVRPSLFRLNIAENTIMFERSDTQTRRILRYNEKLSTYKTDVHPQNRIIPKTGNSVSEQQNKIEEQQSAMDQITRLLQQEFGEWVVHSCPDHAAMLFLLPSSKQIKPDLHQRKSKQQNKNLKAPHFKYS